MRAIRQELTAILGDRAVLAGSDRAYLSDATESRAIRGRADAVALPHSPEEVASVVRWCYEHDVQIIPRGGGTGFAGGAVPLDGGVVIGLERMRSVRRFDPELWRIQLDAGVRTAELRRRARENGLYFPPTPGPPSSHSSAATSPPTRAVPTPSSTVSPGPGSPACRRWWRRVS